MFVELYFSIIVPHFFMYTDILCELLQHYYVKANIIVQISMQWKIFSFFFIYRFYVMCKIDNFSIYMFIVISSMNNPIHSRTLSNVDVDIIKVTHMLP